MLNQIVPHNTTGAAVLDALTAHKLKPAGHGQYHCNSPFRDSSDSQSFSVLIQADGEHGAYHDFVSNESGSLYELARKLGITPVGVGLGLPRPEVTKRAYKNLEDYARAHGVDSSVFARASWSLTEHCGRPALAIPTDNGTRYRLLDGNPKRPPYLNLKGYKACWYKLDLAIDLTKQDGQPLVICNGEASTVVGQHFGIAACTVTSGEKPSLIDEHLALLKLRYPSGTILVVFDSDQTGRDYALQLTHQLQDAGYSARAVDLGFEFGTGGDLADYCKLHLNESRTLLLTCPDLATDQEAQTDERAWRFVGMAELQDMPPVDWLIKDLIPAQSMVVMYGAPGAGKSFVALDFACELARTKHVTYIATEGERGYAKRINAWCQHHHVVMTDLKLTMVMGSLSLMDTMDKADFISVSQVDKPVLVVIDTVVNAMSGADENSTRDMSQYMKTGKELIRKLQCAVLHVHHSNKTGLSERGSSVLRGAADVMMRLDAVDDLVTIECSKTKDEAPFEPRSIRLLKVSLPDGSNSVVPVPADRVIDSLDDPLTITQGKVLSALAEPLYADGAVPSDLEGVLNLHRATIFKILNTLIKRQAIQKAERGLYQITDTGKNLLAAYNRHSKSPETSDDIQATSGKSPALSPGRNATTTTKSPSRPEKSKSPETSDDIQATSGKSPNNESDGRLFDDNSDESYYRYGG